MQLLGSFLQVTNTVLCEVISIVIQFDEVGSVIGTTAFVILLSLFLHYLLRMQATANKLLLEKVIPLSEGLTCAGILWVQQPINEHRTNCFTSLHSRKASNEAPVNGSQREVELVLQLT